MQLEITDAAREGRGRERNVIGNYRDEEIRQRERGEREKGDYGKEDDKNGVLN